MRSMKKTALITGSSGGIGEEFVKLFAADGYDLILVARNEEKLNQLKDDLNEKYSIEITVIAQDLAVSGAASTLYKTVEKLEKKVDVLVNNAGFGDYGFFWETSFEKEESMMQLNMLTLTQLTKLFLPSMIKNKFGRIVNVASTAAFQPGPLMAVYFATKAFVLNLGEALSNELKGTGVKLTTLCPGATKTSFAENASVNDSNLFKKQKVDTPEEVAAFGYKAMNKGKRLAIYGRKNRFLVFSTRLIPRSTVIKVTRKMTEKNG